jgi:hypothetical protein
MTFFEKTKMYLKEPPVVGGKSMFLKTSFKNNLRAEKFLSQGHHSVISIKIII